jgi:hypothetical protein
VLLPSSPGSLRADRRYLTGFTGAGFTNQVLGAMNLLHIASLIGRIETSSPRLVVVLPPVTPNYAHLEATNDAHVDPLPLDSVFDLPAFEQATGLAVVNWHDMKHVPALKAGVESLACWSPTWSQNGHIGTNVPIDQWLGIRTFPSARHHLLPTFMRHQLLTRCCASLLFLDCADRAGHDAVAALAAVPERPAAVGIPLTFGRRPAEPTRQPSSTRFPERPVS